MNLDFFSELGLQKDNLGTFDGNWRETKGDTLDVRSPVDGSVVATVQMAEASDYAACSKAAHEAFLRWRETARTAAR